MHFFGKVSKLKIKFSIFLFYHPTSTEMSIFLQSGLHKLPADSFTNFLLRVSQLVFHNCSARIRLWPLRILIQISLRLNASQKQHTMQPKYRLIPLPKGLYAALGQGEYIKSDHFVVVSDTLHDQLIVHKDCNWMNLVFMADNTESHSEVNSSNVVAAILKKPNASVLVTVIAAPSNRQLEVNSVFVSENCLQNCLTKYKLDESQPIWVQLQEMQSAQRVPQLANKATVFTINQPHEMPNDLVDEILGSYFETPRILYRNYTYEITLNDELLGTHVYVKHLHIFSRLRNLYFRCVHLESADNPFEICAIVVKNMTTLQQTASINMSIPRQVLHEWCPGMPLCPGGLDRYFNSLRLSMLPFLHERNASSTKPLDSCLTSLPVFLMQGSRGSGKTSVLNCVAKDLGLQIYGVDCVDIVSQIASQTEAKLRTALSRANTCEPLILALFNFEVYLCV